MPSGDVNAAAEDGLPPDLLAVLRDQSVIVPQDAAVWELLAEWASAPSDTASADVDWEQAWRFAARKMVESLAERDALVAEVERLRAGHIESERQLREWQERAVGAEQLRAERDVALHLADEVRRSVVPINEERDALRVEKQQALDRIAELEARLERDS